MDIVSESLARAHPFTFLSDHKREMRLRGQAAEILEKYQKPGFLRYFEIIAPENKRSLLRMAEMLASHHEVRLLSAACFHAAKDRLSLVDELSERISSLVEATVVAATKGLAVSSWDFFTFGPGDWEFIKRWEITETLLPYISELSSDEREREFEKQFQLTEQLIARIADRLPFPVNLFPLNSIGNAVDMGEIVEEASRRAEMMYKKLEKKPPAIFKLLPDEEARIQRCRKEAVLYLLFTKVFGSNGTVYLGKEVHGGYWRAGDLNVWGENFLPLTWANPAVTQHWTPWAEDQKSSRLSAYERFLATI